MKPLFALTVASLLAISAPALAQESGTPGATGTGGTLTGSNTGTSGPNATGMHRHMYYHHRHMWRRHHWAMLHHHHHLKGRPPAGDKADVTPREVKGDQNGQDKAKY